MVKSRYSLEEVREAIAITGSQRKAAAYLGLGESSIRDRLKKNPKPFEYPQLPDEELSLEEIISHRKKEFSRIDNAKKSRNLIPIKIKIDGPIGIMHMGDNHVDDPGTDLAKLENHINICNATEGMFAANVGDMSNNWVGRLARLYANQSTSARQAWKLVEWIVGSTQWLYLIGGNHDLFSGAGDPINWMKKQSGSASYEPHGSRIELGFPNGNTCSINARHDFKGTSQWNTAHGPSKAAQMGLRYNILACGHLHTSGYQVVKDPSNGLISHVLRVASYKTYDDYAEANNYPDQNIFCAPVTIINPQYAHNDPRFVTTIFDPETGADFLKFLRRKK